MKKLDFFVLFTVGFMFVFTIVDVVLSINGIYLSSTLEQCAFTYFLGECGITGMIKIAADVQSAIRVRRETLEDRVYFDEKERKKEETK